VIARAPRPRNLDDNALSRHQPHRLAL